MAKVHVTNVSVMNNPGSFFQPFKFELTFECLEELKDDLEWKMIYVGSAESEEYDQILDTIYVGPVPEGRHIFIYQADPPDYTKIPEQDAVGVTIVLITCSYRNQEFVRVGYFINNDYADPELRENPPPKPIFEKLTRNILASKPRVTRFKINWDPSVNGTSSHSNGPMMDIDELSYPASESTSDALASICAINKSHNGETAEMTDDEKSFTSSIPNGTAVVSDSTNSLVMEC